VHTARCNNIRENTKRQHQTKENSQSSIQSFHVPVHAACITRVIPTVDWSTRWLQRKRPALCNVSKDYPLPAYNVYNKLPTHLPPCWELYNMWRAPNCTFRCFALTSTILLERWFVFRLVELEPVVFFIAMEEIGPTYLRIRFAATQQFVPGWVCHLSTWRYRKPQECCTKRN